MKEKEKVLFDFWESPSPFFFRRVRARTSHIAAARTGLVTARVRHALCGLSGICFFWILSHSNLNCINFNCFNFFVFRDLAFAPWLLRPTTQNLVRLPINTRSFSTKISPSFSLYSPVLNRSTSLADDAVCFNSDPCSRSQ